MKFIVSIPDAICQQLRADLFQNRLEQGAFLFAQECRSDDGIDLTAVEYYLVPRDGWDVQHEYRLVLSDEERASVLKRARDGGYALVDCHSHPHSVHEVEFSPSDVDGISEFAQYVRWKLDQRPYAALVWGRRSVDAVGWHSGFEAPSQIATVRVTGPRCHEFVPRGSFLRPRRSTGPRRPRID
jgi:hypothetical protein